MILPHIHRPNARRRVFTPDEVFEARREDIARMHAKAMPLTRIAARVGCGLTTKMLTGRMQKAGML